MPLVDVTRTFLELRDPADLRAGRPPAEPVVLERREGISAHEYRALYGLVGEQWHWRDRLAWSDAALEEYLASPQVSVWVARLAGEVAGYFELRLDASGTAELLYFGLAPRFIGRGLGGWLLTRAAELAFALGARRMALHTCTLDGPRALPNYLARGFRIVRDEIYRVDVPLLDIGSHYG